MRIEHASLPTELPDELRDEVRPLAARIRIVEDPVSSRQSASRHS